MPEQERRIIEGVLGDMFREAIEKRPERRFEKPRFMRLVFQNMMTRPPFQNVQDAFDVAEIGYGNLGLSSGWATISGETRNRYFRNGQAVEAFLGLDQEDCNLLIAFIDREIARLS